MMGPILEYHCDSWRDLDIYSGLLCIGDRLSFQPIVKWPEATRFNYMTKFFVSFMLYDFWLTPVKDTVFVKHSSGFAVYILLN